MPMFQLRHVEKVMHCLNSEYYDPFVLEPKLPLNTDARQCKNNHNEDSKNKF